MDDNKIKSIIKDGKLLWLRNNKSEFFLYYNKYNVLIPIQQDDIKNEYEINYYSSRLYIQLGSISCRRSLIKDGQAKEL